MNPFIFLGIPQNADWEQAQLAYRRLVRTCNSEKIKEDGYHYSIVEFATDVERRAKKAIDDIHKIIFKNH
jgi:curved DNA-binding protein CbpA